jgi:glutamate-1-semialdehyde 2,1-aminomutase
MASAAAVATLELLRDDPPYDRVDATGRKLIEALADLAATNALPLRIQGDPAAFHLSFGDDGEVFDFRGVQARDAARYRRLAERLVGAGIWVAARGIWYVSAAHGEREVDVTLERAESAFAGA